MNRNGIVQSIIRQVDRWIKIRTDKVVSVTDGDTIKVLKDGKQIKIRLASIDCPERGQPYSKAAKRFTAKLVAGRIVTIWPTDTDRYGRTVAFVFVDATQLAKTKLS